MNNSRPYKALTVAILFCVSAAAISMNAFQFKLDPNGDADFIAGPQEKSLAEIRVSASAFGARESQRSFGENLAKYDIQPVWLSIENDTDDQLVYVQIATDPEYYSPYEVSYRFHVRFLPPQTARATYFFFNVRCRASCLLTRVRRALRTAYLMRV